MHVDDDDDFQFPDDEPEAPAQQELTEEELDAYALARAMEKFPDKIVQPQQQSRHQPAYDDDEDDPQMAQAIAKVEQRLTEKARLANRLADQAIKERPGLTPANQERLRASFMSQSLEVLQIAEAQGGHFGAAEQLIGQQTLAGEGTARAVGMAGSPVNSGSGTQASYQPRNAEERASIEAFKRTFGHTYSSRAELEKDILKAFGG